MAGALDDFNLSVTAGEWLHKNISSLEEEVIEELNNSAGTGLVNAMRVCSVSRELVSIGIFSRFETILQRGYFETNPLNSLYEFVLEKDPELAFLFLVYWKANNVLKHGSGHSLTWLEKNSDRLAFDIRNAEQPFFDEGDISEIESFVDTRGNYLDDCLATIQKCWSILADEMNA